MRRLTIVATVASAMLAGTAAIADHAHATTERCHGKIATIVGTAGSDVLHGTAGDDVIAALGSQDFVDGRGGDDLICGGDGDDHLNGNAGNDVLYGGKDRVYDNDGELQRVGDSLRGGPGNDAFHLGRDTRPADEIVPDSLVYDVAPQRVHVDVARGVARGNGHDRFPSNSPIAILGSPFNDTILGGSSA
ncbi:MAG: hypothetical protein JO214_06395, partial [Frankiaceae bacterium]|nr:hypothetical protein [Frankiaceae bacterium]